MQRNTKPTKTRPPFHLLLLTHRAAYCLRPWCYVSLDACVTNSDNRVYRSSYFPSNSGVDLFYSYSVCNSTAEDWLSVESKVLGGGADGEEESVLGGVNIRGAVPSYLVPCEYLSCACYNFKSVFGSWGARGGGYNTVWRCVRVLILISASHRICHNSDMFKRDEAGEIIFDGSDYFDDNNPYEGVYIHYAKQIAEVRIWLLKMRILFPICCFPISSSHKHHLTP